MKKSPAKAPLAKRPFLIWGLAFCTVVALVVVVNVWGSRKPAGEASVRPRVSDGRPGQRAVCTANERDICIMAPTVDFYPAGSEAATNPEYERRSGEAWKSIGGEITAVTGRTVSIKTTSGRTFTVTFPVDAISWWNRTIAPNYDGYQVAIGDTLRVDYSEAPKLSRTTIEASQIIYTVLAIDPTVPTSKTIRRYPTE